MGWDERLGKTIRAPVIQWDGEENVTADEALAATRTAVKKDRSSAQEFLRDILAGGSVLAQVIAERGAAKGFSLQQLKRAKKAVGAVAFKRRGGSVVSPWLWTLPENLPQDVEIED